MKRLLIVPLILLCAFISAHSSTIHWILFVDTNDVSLGVDNLNGKNALEQDFISKVNDALMDKGYNSKKYTYTGNLCSPEKCNQVIQQFSCSPSDIVVFYYIGHGGRPKSNNNAVGSPWPEMEFSANGRNYVSLLTVHNKLKEKKPQLLLTVGMCCNIPKLSHGKEEGMSHQRRRSKTVSKKFAKQIQNWFLSSKGDIIVAAASSGEYAHGGMSYNNKEMDYFTGSLCMLMHDYSSFPEREISWEKFLRDLAYKTSSNVYDDWKEKQTPKSQNNTSKISTKQ